MTNFDYLKSLSVDELAEWLGKYDDVSLAPWDEWFDEKYCQKCDSINTYVPALGREAECAYCEVNDNCRFFQEHEDTLSQTEIIKLWLKENK